MEGIRFNHTHELGGLGRSQRVLSAEEREQLAAAELAAKIARDQAREAEGFCYSCASTSVSMDARLTMRASQVFADNAEDALFELRCKLGVN
jgi:hypothetical protein